MARVAQQGITCSQTSAVAGHPPTLIINLLC